MKKTYMTPTLHVAYLHQHNLICATQPNTPGWTGELDSRTNGWDDDEDGAASRRKNVWDEEEEEW